MRTVQVNASGSYKVEIGSGLMAQLGAYAADCVQGRRATLISDDAVFPLYGPQATASLVKAGFNVSTYIFPQGESSKNGENFLRILNFLAEKRLDRRDLLVALGGGVVGDLTGFAAAVYLRGVAYIQVPTTLLSMVDSSVGGKTAIDLPAGKNLAGAFYQPRCVICDTDVLKTLSAQQFRDGCAEVIKYAILGSPSLFEKLQTSNPRSDPESMIAVCVEMKRDIVEKDEFDVGVRQLLNLGHTIGHAIEAGSGYSLSHGQCVAAGMAVITRAAVRKGYCSQAVCDRIIGLLQGYGLPTATDQRIDTIFTAALGDKKRQGDTITFVVPRQIGHCQLLRIPTDELMSWIEAGLEAGGLS